MHSPLTFLGTLEDSSVAEVSDGVLTDVARVERA